MEDLRILLLEVTQRCNAFCDQCGSRCDMSGEDQLSGEAILGLLSDVRDNLGTDMMLNITGGEPLLRKDLFSIMARARDMGFDWGMVSNGTLIDDAAVKQMKDSGMKTITVSVDGMKETHEQLRHMPGSFDRIVSNVRRLKEAGFLDHLQITFTANAKNAEDFPAVYELFSGIGVDSVRIGFMDPIGRGGEHRELLLEAEAMKRLMDYINRSNRCGGVPIVWGCGHYLKDHIEHRRFVCPTGRTIASVLCNGDIFVCPNVPRRAELIQGNIKRDRFSEVWKKGFAFFRKPREAAFCEGCRYVGECGGDSLHTWNFEEDRPNFCYRELFDAATSRYEAWMKVRFAGCVMTVVAAEGGAQGAGPSADIYIEPSAYREICSYFHFGQKHPGSMYEQQMGLVGFKTEENYVIRYVFPSYIIREGADRARFSRETLIQAERETQILAANRERSGDRGEWIEGELCFLGFCHSHPGQETLCYSSGDEAIHRSLVRRYGDYIGILVNPQKEWIGAYYGEELRQGNLKIIEA